MTKFGQAEFCEYIVKLFVESNLTKVLTEDEKQDLNSRNADDIYSEFLSSKDAA